MPRRLTLATSIADLVAEALTLIENGQLTLAQAANRYGEYWLEMRPFVETALHVARAAQPSLVSDRQFTPLDKAAGWQQLRAQIVQEETRNRPVVEKQPTRQKVHKPRRTWGDWVALVFGTTWGRVASGAVMTVALTLFLTFSVANAMPGSIFYQAKLGWDYTAELFSLTPDARAIASMKYADNRLAELERLAFVGRSDQIAEVQGQYVRALDAGLKYATTPGFNSPGSVFTRLSDQRDRLISLQRYEYALGTRSQLNNILGRVDYTVTLIAASRPGSLPTNTAAPTPEPLPPTPKP